MNATVYLLSGLNRQTHTELKMPCETEDSGNPDLASGAALPMFHLPAGRENAAGGMQAYAAQVPARYAAAQWTEGLM